MMRLGLSTAAFYGRFETEDAAAYMSRLPIDCAEVFLQSASEYDAAFAEQVGRNLGCVVCTSIHPLGAHENFLAQRPQRQKQDAFDTLRRILDAGEALGAKVYVYHGRHTPQLNALGWNPAWNIEALIPMCEEAAKRGMVIGWENVFWCQLTNPQRVLEAKAALPQVRFTLDIKQAIRAGCDPLDFVPAMGTQLCNVHVCDWDESGNLCLPGEGVFDFDRLFAALRAIGYDGPVILEPYQKMMKSDQALLGSLDYLRSRMENV
ncbi:MAG: sugar phosphate isomerase/epimerase [Clostridia bacterium]|nr:sugar phosphate isomerase/epimerase [Clostridia bacterium]